MGQAIGPPAMTRDCPAENFAEEKFRLAVEACPSGMVITDSAGSIVLVNTATECLFGYHRQELVGRRMEMLVPQRLRGEYFKQRAAFALNPQARRLRPSRELFGLRRDATEFPVELWFNPIQTGDGLFVLSVIIDISERRRIDRLKDEFVSTVSHELRTPLTSIAGSLGLLIGGAAGKLPETAARLLGIAESNSSRLVRLINDILDIEKIESGQVVFHFKRLDVRTLLEQAIEANRAYADGFGVRLHLDTVAAGAEVHADPDRLSQVMTNLLSNAIKFSPRGGEVAVAVERRAEIVCISVRDHGDGIPAEFQPRVFERFAQADAGDARQKGGTGLGLSIVREIVAQLGGAVGFLDAEGGGTVFYVELPAWEQIAGREIDTAGSAQAVRILFCEDDPAAAMMLREGLRPLGFSTDFAHHPAEAVARARDNGYAAIVIDFELADASGMDFIRWLREQPEIYKTPIVIASRDRIRDKEQDGGLNSLNWIAKPIDVYELAQLLDGAAARGTGGPPCILHVEDDHDVLDLVACALEPTGPVVSADSIEKAREALLTHHFDLAVLDITLGPVCGLELLPELRQRDGTPIPVVIFSAQAGTPASDPQVQARLSKWQASLDDLVEAVHDRLMLRSAQAQEEPA
ncbi:MAG: ATP-binding protein [Xanthobacteraceae bacterium]